MRNVIHCYLKLHITFVFFSLPFWLVAGSMFGSIWKQVDSEFPQNVFQGVCHDQFYFFKLLEISKLITFFYLVIATFFHNYHSNRFIRRMLSSLVFCHLLFLSQWLLILSYISFHQDFCFCTELSPIYRACDYFHHFAYEALETKKFIICCLTRKW